MIRSEFKSVLIIANGEPPNDRLLSSLLEISDCVIAADGGGNLCFQKKITPHFIVGDLDSIDSGLLSHFKDTEIIHQPDQNTHDLDKSIIFARSLNPHIIRITAALGKRLDHSLANLFSFQSRFENTPLEIYENSGILKIVKRAHVLHLRPGTTVSLFSFNPVVGLSLLGFKYQLSNQNFPHGFNGLCNIVTEKEAKISVKKGNLFLYIKNEDATT
jgi:thiamine pyrophosphokinase